MQEYNDKRLVTVGGRSGALLNKTVGRLAKVGISLMGSRLLSVRGRKSGEWRSTPVNVLTVDGQRYLVAPRGHTQWVRNLRVNTEGRLTIGRRTENFRAEELADPDKPEILRAYLKKWAWEVGAFFGDDVRADSPTEALLHVAPGFPVFKIHAI
ncbi:nitroreductase family deazaflavin-dependent oxidoreductase [Kribbella qitaiheensis]|uniref:nitroreductase family deazaflavin-dependent oxidoreductase n=1 Tax=Kribbella qitaiheensis TaxID=1544730 RepID=UPI0036224E76